MEWNDWADQTSIGGNPQVEFRLAPDLVYSIRVFYTAEQVRSGPSDTVSHLCPGLPGSLRAGCRTDL